MHTMERAAESLALFTSLALVVPQMQERTTAGVARELNELLHLHAGLPEAFFFTPARLCHELLTSTTLNRGMLVAPVRSAPVTKTHFALGRAPEPLPWRAQWLPAVEFVCLVVEPASKSSEFRQVLAGLTRLACDAETIGQLRAAGNAEEMLAVLERLPLTTRQGQWSRA